MDVKRAVDALGALAQDSRLAVFRLLVRRGPAGLPAGEISRRVEVPPTTLSFHLAHLSRAGLVTSRREGRSILYGASFTGMQELIAFLLENCCQEEGGCAPRAAKRRSRR